MTQENSTTSTTVQMSVRVKEEVYHRFKGLCKEERRTNGDMLQQMLEQYLSGDAGGPARR